MGSNTTFDRFGGRGAGAAASPEDRPRRRGPSCAASRRRNGAERGEHSPCGRSRLQRDGPDNQAKHPKRSRTRKGTEMRRHWKPALALSAMLIAGLLVAPAGSATAQEQAYEVKSETYNVKTRHGFIYVEVNRPVVGDKDVKAPV